MIITKMSQLAAAPQLSLLPVALLCSCKTLLWPLVQGLCSRMSII